MKALELKNLSKSFGSLQVLQDISIAFEAGERRAIIGPNGAGKTTLFNVISGINKASSGEIRIFGNNVTNMPFHRRSRFFMARTFQQNNLFFGLNLHDNLCLAVHNHDLPQSIRELLINLDLWKKRKSRVGELSYGEQRQVELLLALAQRPKILMLDEPTAGLSPMETQMIADMINKLPRDLTLLIIEHDMEVVYDLADYVAILHNGSILCEGKKELIKTDPKVTEAYLGTHYT